MKAATVSRKPRVISRKPKLAGAIRYAMSRWAVETIIVRPTSAAPFGKSAAFGWSAMRYGRPVRPILAVTRLSCGSAARIWYGAPGTTWAASEDAVLAEPADAMVRDAGHCCGFSHRDPFVDDPRSGRTSLRGFREDGHSFLECRDRWAADVLAAKPELSRRYGANAGPRWRIGPQRPALRSDHASCAASRRDALLACDLRQRPSAARKQGNRLPLELIRNLTTAPAHSTTFPLPSQLNQGVRQFEGGSRWCPARRRSTE
jgi:hypothetical protein